VFLSAGIDSTVIAALAAELGAKLQTVTLAFDDYRGSDDDEALLAEETARVLRTDHVTVRMSREEFMFVIDDFIHAMDQPTIDGLNTYLVSRAAAAPGTSCSADTLRSPRSRSCWLGAAVFPFSKA
jgi:asparagine synthase (glutamine-hydrolysing)